MLTTFVRLLTGITFFTLSLAGATAPLDKNADSEQKARVFHLNVSPNGYPPYLIVRDNDYSGILWDVMTLVTEKMNFRIEAVKIPRKRVDQMMQDGYMDGKTILTHLGYEYPVLDALFDSGKTLRFDVSQDENQLRYLLDAGRFDATIIDPLVAQWIIRNKPEYDGKFLATDNTLKKAGLRLMVHTDMVDFLEEFNAELERLKASGQLDAIISRYQ